jgi:hypothetical protein
MAGKCTIVDPVLDVLTGSFVVSLPVLAIGSNQDDVANAAFDYNINGVRYTKAAITTGTAPGTDVIPEDLFGAVAYDIDAAGTITVASATYNVTGYLTADLAVSGIPPVASGLARMGTVSASGSAAAFTFGTTLLDAANTTVAYTDGITNFQALALL